MPKRVSEMNPVLVGMFRYGVRRMAFAAPALVLPFD
jgi:hypothetical protein